MKIPRNATLQKRISKWGKGDKLTLKVLNTIQLKGTWLNLAAGDGRYIPELLKKVDKLISTNAPRYPLKNVSRTDLAILRLSVFDLIIDQKIPEKVIIDEAVMLAKELSGERSYAFVNAVLGKILSNTKTK